MPFSRVIRGNWQLAGGHGAVSQEQALDILEAAFDAGLTTFDCADIYTGVEALIGAFRARLVARRGAEAAARPPGAYEARPRPRPPRRDLEISPSESIVDESLRRLRPGAARPRAVPLVGHTRFRAPSTRWSGSTRSAGPARSASSGAPISTHRAHARHPRRRRTAGLDADAIFPARRPSRERPGGPLRRQ